MQAERDETVGGGPTRDHIGASISASEMHSKDYGSNISSSIDARRGGDVGGNHTSPPPSLEVETLPDVPEEPRVVCKVWQPPLYSCFLYGCTAHFHGGAS